MVLIAGYELHELYKICKLSNKNQQIFFIPKDADHVAPFCRTSSMALRTELRITYRRNKEKKGGYRDAPNLNKTPTSVK